MIATVGGRMNSGFLDRYRAEAGDVLDAILTHSRDCIKLLTVKGEIEYASNSAASALGIGQASEAVGKSWRLFWPTDVHGRLDAAVAAAANGASTRFDGETRDAGGTVRVWEVTISPVRGDDRTITHLLAVSSDITPQVQAAEHGRERWESAEKKVGQADVVTRELRHRLKNQLAVVGAVAKLLARHTSDAKELSHKLEDKLIALARAQDLLTIMRAEPIGAREAVEQVLRASGAGERIEIGAFPETTLPDESVQQLALILNELQTNALKHGALSDVGGRVHLAGEDRGEALSLRWEEHCERPVVAVEGGAGGFQLIQRLGSANGHHPAINWMADGIQVDFHVRTTG